jgi:Recombinase zinc beta ribbon domain
MLRCGRCGEALVPRSGPNRKAGPYEVYRCYGRHRDKNSCSMPPIPRALIDTAVYDYFEKLGLDVEATRRQLAESRDRKLAEVRALLEQAKAEARRAEGRLARVRGHYQDGKLDPDDWAEQRVQLTEELDAAGSELERLRDQEQEVSSWGELRDVEADTLRWLAEIRSAIAGEVRDTESVEAVRAALSRLFEGFVVHPQGNPQYGRKHRDDPAPAGPDIAPLLDVEDFTIEIWVREQALVGYDASLAPVLRRKGIALPKTTEYVALTR